jgi:hypothetical protein
MLFDITFDLKPFALLNGINVTLIDISSYLLFAFHLRWPCSDMTVNSNGIGNDLRDLNGQEASGFVAGAAKARKSTILAAGIALGITTAVSAGSGGVGDVPLYGNVGHFKCGFHGFLIRPLCAAVEASQPLTLHATQATSSSISGSGDPPAASSSSSIPSTSQFLQTSLEVQAVRASGAEMVLFPWEKVATCDVLTDTVIMVTLRYRCALAILLSPVPFCKVLFFSVYFSVI